MLEMMTMPLASVPPPDQHKAPIYDTCDHCRFAIRPGESHGVVQPDDQGEPQLVCKIQRLELVEQVVPAIPASLRP